MSQEVNKLHMEEGHVMQSREIRAFKLFGGYYTTNPNRKKRYSMDDTSWKWDEEKGFFWRLSQVLSGKVYRLP